MILSSMVSLLSLFVKIFTLKTVLPIRRVILVLVFSVIVPLFPYL